MPWCSRAEIREVGAAAQRIHDDIAEGRLTIHLHADDGYTTVAVGSYATGVRRHVHLHGENHLRQVCTSYDDETEAVTEFQRLYSVAVRPGPALLADLEQAVRRLLAGTIPSTSEETSAPAVEAPIAEPGEQEAFFSSMFDEERQWERYRPFDETTIASHESLSVRVEFDHEARHRTDVAWTIAEYDGSVGERLWHATLTAGTPVPLIHTILQHLDAPRSPLRATRTTSFATRPGTRRATPPAPPGRRRTGASSSSPHHTPWRTDGRCTAEKTSTGRRGASGCPTGSPRSRGPARRRRRRTVSVTRTAEPEAASGARPRAPATVPAQRVRGR
ncbi:MULTISPECIES: DUF317 domain-containing protein [Streptomyces]|uniref:DUF317 domain-containing protein n=1 Tax=Streptomyces TaxID=1883 RepID=UPI0022581734|nr:DUF317 domain-containing protein [Streptomyces sp. NBC_00160]MCX5301913.1 DUF317 domain-containing protein [Streptomyces sp. NBC_00160]